MCRSLRPVIAWCACAALLLVPACTGPSDNDDPGFTARGGTPPIDMGEVVLPVEEDVEQLCSDAFDNDDDGAIDCADSSCLGRSCAPDERGVCSAGQCAGGEDDATCADGLDNDRDGVADCDDMDCFQLCTGSGDTCGNGMDDDGDGAVDEGCPCVYTLRPTGVCRRGTLTAQGTCQAPAGYQSNEFACDGLDNDCDGAVDEGCSCTFQDRTDGLCAFATRDVRGVCESPILYQEQEGLCDGLDNDCDGEVDLGCVVCDWRPDSFGEQIPIVGVCSFGVVDQDTMNCEPPLGFQPVETRCDGADNDCDGLVDEGCPCAFENIQLGACTRGSLGPHEDLDALVCNAPPTYEDEETQCDGVDNDCDGLTDESCTSCFVGGLSLGVCQSGVLLEDGMTCESPDTYEVDELSCDELDNDCDGTVDEGCACDVFGRDQGACVGGGFIDGRGRCLPESPFIDFGGESCDGVDNDCDGALETVEMCGVPEVCANGLDDDLDGKVDCEDEDCPLDACARRIFVTPRAYTGDLRGIAGADTICMDAARGAGLSGSWRALLTANKMPITDRVVLNGSLFSMAEGSPIVLSDGTRFAVEDDEFLTSRLSFGPRGEPLNTVDVWTGRFVLDDRPMAFDCSGFTSSNQEEKGWAGWVVATQDRPVVAGGDFRPFANARRIPCMSTARIMCVGGQPAEDCDSPGDDDGDTILSVNDPDCREP